MFIISIFKLTKKILKTETFVKEVKVHTFVKFDLSWGLTHTIYNIVSLWQKIHKFSILFYEARVCVTLKIDMFSSFLCVSGIAVRSWHWPLMGIQKRNLTMTTLTLKIWTVCQSWQQEHLLLHQLAPPAGKNFKISNK